MDGEFVNEISPIYGEEIKKKFRFGFIIICFLFGNRCFRSLDKFLRTALKANFAFAWMRLRDTRFDGFCNHGSVPPRCRESSSEFDASILPRSSCAHPRKCTRTSLPLLSLFYCLAFSFAFSHLLSFSISQSFAQIRNVGQPQRWAYSNTNGMRYNPPATTLTILLPLFPSAPPPPYSPFVSLSISGSFGIVSCRLRESIRSLWRPRACSR